ncbi:protein TTE1956-like [Folsomia candida]|uniref:protein TTE1956-like n=1 Tax=Folsomia candida TaxID=158441 RepID=UPI001604D757|nr:protein TTE1956-like [Folsomia candida]
MVLISLSHIILSTFVIDVLVKSATITRSQPFVGFFVFPHGGITLNPKTHDFSEEGGTHDGTREEAIRLHEAMRSAAKVLMETKPDVVILSTPHGYYLEERYLFIGNPSMAGNAGWEWENISANFNIDQESTVQLYLDLARKQNPVELLSFGVGQTQMDIKWGEVIPWHFIQEAAVEVGIPLPSVIYMGQPPIKRITELIKLGKDLASYVLSSMTQKRVVVLISADLSHYHANDPKAPYPFNPNSVVFDGFIKEWGQIDRSPEMEAKSAEVLLTNAEAVSDSAGSCGYTGLVMLHSIMGSVVDAGMMTLKVKFYEYFAPTYFGMMITSWIPTT